MMSAIIDTNVLLKFFESRRISNQLTPIREWIESASSSAKLVIGGTKCLSEIKKLKQVIQPLGELSKMRKLELVDTGMVDAEANRLKLILPPSGAFDDEQILSLCNISGVRIVATDDKRLIRYYGNRKIVRSHVPGIKFYTRERNQTLLCRNYCPVLRNTIDVKLLPAMIRAAP